jgi:tetratricopeptide (TPR) repeat protein
MTIALILSIFAWPYISVFCHELGHFVCAKLVGMSPYLMKVGSGFSISSNRFFGARIELGIHLFSFNGETRAHFPTNWSTFKDLKPKLIIYCLGGCLANSILLAFSIEMLANTGFPIFLYFISIEVVTIIGALVPMNILLYGRKHPNDAKQIFLILTKDYQQYFLTELQKDLTRMDENLAGPYILLKNDTGTIELFVKAVTEINYRHFDEAIALYNRLLRSQNASGAERVYFLDILASIVIVHGQKQYLTQADVWSQEAMKLAGHSKTVQGTRGAILIELGRYEEGMRMLFQLTEPDNYPLDIAISSCCLAKAEHRLGNNEQAWNWFKLAEKTGNQVPELYEMFARVKEELSESLN